MYAGASRRAQRERSNAVARASEAARKQAPAYTIYQFSFLFTGRFCVSEIIDDTEYPYDRAGCYVI